MKRKNLIVSAVLTIALCVSLIAGSTYAIFTSSDQFNIAANSATVKLVATADDLKVYTELESGVVSYENSTADANGNVLFENGGYAKLNDGHNLDIVNMTPGDGVELKINIDNTETNVAIQYRVVLTVKGELAPALTSTVTDAASTNAINIPVDSNSATDAVVIASDWRSIDVDELDSFGPLTVNVFFPNGTPEHDNAFQGKTCQITVRIEAVQGNADTTGVIVP